MRMAFTKVCRKLNEISIMGLGLFGHCSGFPDEDEPYYGTGGHCSSRPQPTHRALLLK